MPNSDCDSKLSLETQKYPLTVRPSKMSPQWQLSSKTTVVFKGKKVCPHKYSCTKHTHAQTNKCVCLCFPLPLSLLGVQRTRVSWSRGGAELSELVREPNLRDYRPSTDPLQTLRFSSLCCHWGDTLIFYLWTTETDSFFYFPIFNFLLTWMSKDLRYCYSTSDKYYTSESKGSISKLCVFGLIFSQWCARRLTHRQLHYWFEI